ncbi:MAG: hypothetical protein IKX60_04230 [Bacteroidales bacterium]|nr:hypothetical protein [Bacteroidales bacterium]
MKKVFYLFTAAMLVLAGCQENISVIEKAGNNKTIVITLAQQTKATISDSNSGAASFAWEEGDEIGVETSEGLVKFTLESFVDDRAVFKAPADFTGSLSDGAFVAYPYVADDYKDGNYALSFPSVYEVDKADAFRLRWSGVLVEQADGTYQTGLEHQTAILRVSYSAVPEVTAAVKMVAGSDEVTVKFSFTPEGDYNFYFPVKEGSYDRITVTLLDADLDVINGTEQTLSAPDRELVFAVGSIYRTPTITLNLYQLVESSDMVEDGDYVLAYYDSEAGEYKLFSFEKTMENAETAAADVANVQGLSNLFAQGGHIYSTVISKNYVSVPGDAGAVALNIPAEAEASAKLSVEGNAYAANTTLSTDGYSLRLDKVITSVAEGGAATLSVQPNAPDAIAIMNELRGHTVSITFDELIGFAVEQAKKEGVTFTDAQVARLRSGFNHLCSLAKEILANHEMGTLMDITVDTDIFTVIAQYYDNAAAYSLQVSEEKKFGWATPVGFHKYDDGFTANVSVPSKGWFDRLQASLAGDKDACVAYWAQFDSQYNIAGIENFFQRLARRAVNELDDSTYAMLQEINFTAIGNVYGKYVNKFNDNLEPVYLYKKLQ